MRGLSGIPERRSLGEGSIYRPLLNFDRNSISEFAKRSGCSGLKIAQTLKSALIEISCAQRFCLKLKVAGLTIEKAGINH